jgi:hypothetical protein
VIAFASPKGIGYKNLANMRPVMDPRIYVAAALLYSIAAARR